MLNDRLLYELGLLVELKARYPELVSMNIITESPLTVKIVLSIHRFSYEFDIVFPRYFPFQPIIIKAITEFYTPHIYNDGSMCLKWGIDNWIEEITIKDMIQNLMDLLETENPLGETHKASESGDFFSTSQQVLRSQGGTLFISKDIIPLFKREHGFGTIIAKSPHPMNVRSQVYFLTRIGRKHIIETSQNDRSFEKLRFEYHRINQTFDDFTKSNPGWKFDFSENYWILVFKDRVLARRIVLPTEQQKKSILRTISEGNYPQYRNMTEEEIITTIRISQDIDVSYWEQEQANRIGINESILNRKISIFGLGSVGSRVFLDLARAGFRNFNLIDDDLMLPNNVIRHELTMNDVGKFKVFALSEKADGEINPNINVKGFNFALNGQMSSSSVNDLFDNIDDSSIIIDCTADTNLIFSLNEFIQKKDMAYLAGTVISGGLGNILIKRDKGNSLSIIDILETQKIYMKYNGIQQSNQTNYEGRYGDTSYVATMSDVSILAGLIGKTAINMLINDPMMQLDHSIYVMSTSQNFLGGFYNCQPISANKRNYEPMPLDPKIIQVGKEYYENRNPAKME